MTEFSPSEPQTVLPLHHRVRRVARRLRNKLSGRRTREMFQLAIVIPLEKPAAERAIEAQREVQRRFGSNPGLEAQPHISLKLGFLACDSVPFEQYVDEVARTVEPFQISLRGFGSFDDGVVFVDVAQNERLEALRQQILSDLERRFGVEKLPIENEQFRFHVTIAHSLPPRAFAEMRDEESGRSFEESFEARHIDLFRYCGDHWETLRRATVGKAETRPELLHRRQFLLCEAGQPWRLPGGIETSIGEKYRVSAHPDLEVSQVENGPVSLTLLGFALDPDHPERSNREILRHLLETAPERDDLPLATEAWGGRWILIRHDPAGLLLIHDAIGQRQIYHGRDPAGRGFVCASDAGIVARALQLEPAPEAVEFIRSRGESDFEIYWIPGDRSLFAGVSALLPNHSLSLPESEVRRFWPLAPVEAVGEQEAATAECLRLLRGVIEAARNRFPLAVPMTAGWDSRLMLALCREDAAELHAFTLDYPNLPRQSRDVWVPERLLGLLGIPHHLIPYPGVIDREFKRIYRTNIASANDAYCADAQALRGVYPDAKVCVTGDAAEVVKCFYKRSRPDSEPLAADELVELAGLGSHPFVRAAFDDWLRDAGGAPVDLLDLFCWEQMGGRWQAQVRAEFDMVQESFAPLNNRRLLRRMLGFDRSQLEPPHFRLFSRLIAELWPEVMGVPINPPEVLGRKRRALDALKKTGLHRLLPAAGRAKLKALLKQAISS